MEDLKVLLALNQPFGDKFGIMHFEVVDDQKDFPVAIGNHPFHETDQQVGVHGFFNELEAYQSLVADGETIYSPWRLLGAAKYRRLTRRDVATKPVTIFRHRCFVTPENRGAFRPWRVPQWSGTL